MAFNIYPPIIGHRGACALAPENTIPSFLKARTIGLNWVEFDVTLAQCGEVVVIHDDTLDRTTHFKGYVNDYPYSFLKTLDAGCWFDKEFAGTAIPTLIDVISLLRNQKLAANIEIKALPGKELETVERVLDVVNTHWTKDMAEPLFSSFSIPILKNFRKLNTQANLALLLDEWLPSWQVIADELNCMSVNLNYEIASAEIISLIKNTHRVVMCYTVNNPLLAKQLFSNGVDAVFSDCPNNFVQDVLAFIK